MPLKKNCSCANGDWIDKEQMPVLFHSLYTSPQSQSAKYWSHGHTHLRSVDSSFEGSNSTFALPEMPAVQTQMLPCLRLIFMVRVDP